MSKFGGGSRLSPLDERTIASVETMLGLRLPQMLRAMYRDVGESLRRKKGGGRVAG
jgi:hypothetical protein